MNKGEEVESLIILVTDSSPSLAPFQEMTLQHPAPIPFMLPSSLLSNFYIVNWNSFPWQSWSSRLSMGFPITSFQFHHLSLVLKPHHKPGQSNLLFFICRYHNTLYEFNILPIKKSSLQQSLLVQSEATRSITTWFSIQRVHLFCEDWHFLNFFLLPQSVERDKSAHSCWFLITQTQKIDAL